MKQVTMKSKWLAVMALGILVLGSSILISACGSKSSPTTPTSPTDTSTPGSPTATFTITLTPTVTHTPTITRTPTITLTPTATSTHTKTPTVTATPTITETPVFSYTRTGTPTVTTTPGITSTPTLVAGNYVDAQVKYTILNSGPTTVYTLYAWVATNGNPDPSAGVTITDPNTTAYELSSLGTTVVSNGVSCVAYAYSPSSFSLSGTFSLAVSTALGSTTSTVSAVTGTSTLASGDLSVSWSTSDQFNLLTINNLSVGGDPEVFSSSSNTSPVAIASSNYISTDMYLLEDSRYNASALTGGTGSFAYFQTNEWEFTY
jgi:hypothetical protein